MFKEKSKQADEKEIVEKQYERFSPNYSQGLNQSQINERIKQNLTNLPIDKNFKSVNQIIMENTFTYFNLIFIIFSILLILVQSYKNLTFLPVIVANTLIGIIQEIRSKKILDNLNVLTTNEIDVIREGQEIKIPIDQLVLDDIVHFKSGNQIPADAKVIFGEIKVNESLLTGESDEISKKIGANLMSGSFIVSGECYGQIEKVGAESYISKLTNEAKNIKKTEQSEMITVLNKLVKWVGIIIIPIGLLLFYQSFFLNGHSLKESIVSMEAALIGMIPEGLYLLTTVALALGATRLAKKKVLLHNMKSIETLARINILCVDKTGTITENKMSVERLVKSSVHSDDDKFPVAQLIGDFANNMPAENATMEAIKAYFVKNSGRSAIAYTTFSSVEKFSSVTFDEGTYIIGAPEIVLHNHYDDYKAEITGFTNNGLRVLVFGKYPDVLNEEKIEYPVTPLGYIILSNPIRSNAKETFEYFEKQGVAIKVISGDNPSTVSYVASKAGIKGAEKYIDARTLVTPEVQAQALKENTVFGRVTPEQKKLFVEILKNNGNTVAMTGDGVNDILAMKESDCSVAMASGNDATVHAAQVVLLESEFSRMPEIVSEGRRVVNNIERSSSLFLVKNIFSLLMSLFALFFSLIYPLQPSQITLISLFTIGLPSFLLALEPNNQRIKGSFILNILRKAIPGGITDMLIVGSLVICGAVFKFSNGDISTTATLLLIVVGFLVLYKICSPMNSFRRKIFIFCLSGMLVASLFFSSLFSLTKISAISFLLLIILFFTAESLFRILTKVSEFIECYFKNTRAQKD
ncbi:MAG: cation-translocating P-type ATPase [Streptococcaceae bacterium]|jgi:cation-transporting ATPase E|nr:cation-translocating P-type ATPase [Streptococcaceae bacterium]MCH4176114.1 cation-translocating P-type ATPase [Streptococcaceae bacterium]